MSRPAGDLEAKLEQFTVNAGRAPQRVLLAHSSDQITQLAINLRSSCPLSRFPAPVAPEPRPMPPQDRCRLHHLIVPSRLGHSRVIHTNSARSLPRSGRRAGRCLKAILS